MPARAATATGTSFDFAVPQNARILCDTKCPTFPLFPLQNYKIQSILPLKFRNSTSFYTCLRTTVYSIILQHASDAAIALCVYAACNMNLNYTAQRPTPYRAVNTVSVTKTVSRPED